MRSIPALTRFMVTLASTCVAAVLTCAVLPSPVGALGTLLIGAVGLVGLRASAQAARRVGMVAAAMMACASAAMAVSRADPGAVLDGLGAALLSPALRDPDCWLPALLSAGLVLGSAPLAVWAAAGLEECVPAPLAAAPARQRPGRLPCVEAELARAAEKLEELSLALLGVDQWDEGDPTRVMRLLDEAVAANLSPADALCEYGPTERLVVLPGVSASDLRAGAGLLCKAAAELAGLPVRAALATFPADGSSLRYLLDGLELGLASCRAGGATVAWGQGATLGVPEFVRK